MSRGNAILLAIVVAIALIAVAAASILHDGLSSRANPTALETMMARNARGLAIPAGARKLQNPAGDTQRIYATLACTSPITAPSATPTTEVEIL